LGFDAFMAYLDSLMRGVRQRADQCGNQDQTDRRGPRHLGRDQVKGVCGHDQQPAGQTAEEGGDDQRAQRCQFD
jgi:hypothetical protein